MRQIFKKVFIIIICIILFWQVVSIAATQSELNNKRDELTTNVNEAKDKQNQIEKEVNATKTELEKINEEIIEKEYEIDKVTAELNDLTNDVNKLKNDLEEAQKQYDKQYDLLCDRIVAQYKRGSVSYLDVLLNSSSLSDFISNYYIVGKIAEWDTELLEDIEENKQIIENSKREVEKKQSEVAEKQAQLKVEEMTLTNKKQNKNKYIAQLSAEEQKLQKEIDALNAEIRRTDKEIEELAKQTGNGHVYTGGKLKWPVPVYKRISSYFGYRGSAATGGVGTAYHNGYDIAADHYSNIVASASGTVMKVVNACSHDYPKTVKNKCNCGGGYGNYIMINHDGLITLYGHVATGSIKVKVGQHVNAGDVIAGVGSCGWSTGYHLHFSVINEKGQYVNPGDYLGS